MQKLAKLDFTKKFWVEKIEPPRCNYEMRKDDL